MTPDVDEIKGALRRCKTVQEVNACAKHFGYAVTRMARSSCPDLRVMTIQIRNLADYRRKGKAEGWGK